MNTPPTISLELVHARQSPRTVILRRGPSKLVRCILWHRDTDRFEDGQWLKGRVWVGEGGLSPDGEHLIYLAHKENWQGSEVGYWYTVISRPPWFTALALYPDGMFYGEGGYFLDEKRYVINGNQKGRDHIGKARELEQVLKVEPSGSNTLGYAHLDGRRVNLRAGDIAYLSGEAPVMPPEDIRTEAGRLYRGDTLIRDFTDMSFEPLRAPYDDRPDPENEDPIPWHPLDRDDAP